MDLQKQVREQDPPYFTFDEEGNLYFPKNIYVVNEANDIIAIDPADGIRYNNELIGGGSGGVADGIYIDNTVQRVELTATGGLEFGLKPNHSARNRFGRTGIELNISGSKMSIGAEVLDGKTIRAANVELPATIAAVDARVTGMTGDVERLKDANAGITGGLNDVRNEQQRQDGFIIGLRTDVGGIKDAVTQLQSFDTALESRVEELENSDDVVTDLVKELDERVTEVEKDLEKLGTKVDGVITTSGIVEGRVVDLERRVGLDEINLKDYKASNDLRLDSDENRIKALEEAMNGKEPEEGQPPMDTLVERVVKLESGLETTKAELGSLDTLVHKHIEEDVHNIKRTEFNTLAGTVNLHEAAIGDLTTEATVLGIRIDGVVGDLATLDGVVGDAVANISVLRTDVGDIQDDVVGLKTAVEPVVGLVTELENLESKVDGILGTMSDLTEVVEGHGARLGNLEPKVNVLETAVGSLEVTVEGLETGLEAAIVRLDTAESTIDGYEDRIHALENAGEGGGPVVLPYYAKTGKIDFSNDDGRATTVTASAVMSALIGTNNLNAVAATIDHGTVAKKWIVTGGLEVPVGEGVSKILGKSLAVAPVDGTTFTTKVVVDGATVVGAELEASKVVNTRFTDFGVAPGTTGGSILVLDDMGKIRIGDKDSDKIGKMPDTIVMAEEGLKTTLSPSGIDINGAVLDGPVTGDLVSSGVASRKTLANVEDSLGGAAAGATNVSQKHLLVFAPPGARRSGLGSYGQVPIPGYLRRDSVTMGNTKVDQSGVVLGATTWDETSAKTAKQWTDRFGAFGDKPTVDENDATVIYNTTAGKFYHTKKAQSSRDYLRANTIEMGAVGNTPGGSRDVVLSKKRYGFVGPNTNGQEPLDVEGTSKTFLEVGKVSISTPDSAKFVIEIDSDKGLSWERTGTVAPGGEDHQEAKVSLSRKTVGKLQQLTSLSDASPGLLSLGQDGKYSTVTIDDIVDPGWKPGDGDIEMGQETGDLVLLKKKAAFKNVDGVSIDASAVVYGGTRVDPDGLVVESTLLGIDTKVTISHNGVTWGDVILGHTDVEAIKDLATAKDVPTSGWSPGKVLGVSQMGEPGWYKAPKSLAWLGDSITPGPGYAIGTTGLKSDDGSLTIKIGSGTVLGKDGLATNTMTFTGDGLKSKEQFDVNKRFTIGVEKLSLLDKLSQPEKIVLGGPGRLIPVIKPNTGDVSVEYKELESSFNALEESCINLGVVGKKDTGLNWKPKTTAGHFPPQRPGEISTSPWDPYLDTNGLHFKNPKTGIVDSIVSSHTIRLGVENVQAVKIQPDSISILEKDNPNVYIGNDGITLKQKNGQVVDTTALDKAGLISTSTGSIITGRVSSDFIGVDESEGKWNISKKEPRYPAYGTFSRLERDNLVFKKLGTVANSDLPIEKMLLDLNGLFFESEEQGFTLRRDALAFFSPFERYSGVTPPNSVCSATFKAGDSLLLGQTMSGPSSEIDSEIELNFEYGYRHKSRNGNSITIGGDKFVVEIPRVGVVTGGTSSSGSTRVDLPIHELISASIMHMINRHVDVYSWMGSGVVKKWNYVQDEHGARKLSVVEGSFKRSVMLNFNSQLVPINITAGGNITVGFISPFVEGSKQFLQYGASLTDSLKNFTVSGAVVTLGDVDVQVDQDATKVLKKGQWVSIVANVYNNSGESATLDGKIHMKYLGEHYAR